MSLFLISLFFICLFGLSFRLYQSDYLSISQTTSVKGLFTLLIFLSHAKGYCSIPPSDLGMKFLSFLGQMVVVMFFFYSGFGIMKQYEDRGKRYLTAFPKNRILKLLVHFDIAVLLYLIVQTLLGNYFPFSHYVLCWIGWASIGNSCWFIFNMIILYIIIYCSLSIANRMRGESNSISVVILFSFTILFWLLLRCLKTSDTYWYNTLIAFPLGAAYSQVHLRIDSFHERYSKPFAIIVMFAIVVWVMMRKRLGIDSYGLSSSLFALIVVGVTSFISIDNSALRWLGRNCFYIYILQRLPMILLSYLGLNHNPRIFIICAFVFTALIAECFSRLTRRLDNVLFA